MRPLDAARITSARGDVIELRAPSCELRDQAWERLTPELSALTSRSASSPLAWDSTAEDAYLAPLSILDRASIVATLPRGARWSPSVTSFASPLGELSSGASLWSLSARAHAGRWTLSALRGDDLIASVSVEVRTRKLDSGDGWRALLDDLARADLGLAAHETSPFDAAWSDADRSPRSALEALLLLRAIVEGDTLSRALDDVARDPATALTAASRTVPAHRATRARPEELAARAVGADDTANAREHAPALSRDVAENRFVLFALDALERASRGLALGPRELSLAARRDASRIADRLHAARVSLSRGALRGVGSLVTPAPLGSASMQRRRGYRELFAAWSRLGAAPGPLSLGEPSRVGLSDAPRLYERWCALEVARSLGASLDDAARVASGGASLTLTLDRRVVTLASQEPAGSRSYSLAFRPDLTLTSSGRRLHFDAKYQLDDEGEGDDAPSAAIAKMHAYRDAIEGTWGAFALYPATGDRVTSFAARGGGGVGAVALRPGDTVRDAQRASVGAIVRRFLSAV